MSDKKIIVIIVIVAVVVIPVGALIAIKAATGDKEHANQSAVTVASKNTTDSSAPNMQGTPTVAAAAPASPGPAKQVVDDATQQELKRLRAENERLAKEAAAVKHQQAAKTPPPVVRQQQKPGSITGSMWITRNSGASDLIRGQEIILYPATIPASEFVASMQDVAAKWRARAQEARQKAKTDTFLKDYHESDAKEADEQALKVGAFQYNGVKVIDTAMAYDSVAKASHLQLGRLRTAPLQLAKTGADAKYRFDNLQPGNYYVHTFFFASEAGRADWIVPVTVKSGAETQLDLENDNAHYIGRY
ncbi:MAG: hypothetical protein WBD40_04270 [Tepidisphaeraceae bacterium]